MLSPVNIPRYAKFPLGNGVPMHLCEYSLESLFYGFGFKSLSVTEKFRANNLISVGLRDSEFWKLS